MMGTFAISAVAAAIPFGTAAIAVVG